MKLKDQVVSLGISPHIHVPCQSRPKSRLPDELDDEEVRLRLSRARGEAAVGAALLKAVGMVPLTSEALADDALGTESAEAR
jgi:hypothetical protein